MYHSRSKELQGVQWALQALNTDLVERPVPVVVVKFTEEGRAYMDPIPQLPGEGHSHVVQVGSPGDQVGLKHCQNVFLFPRNKNTGR